MENATTGRVVVITGASAGLGRAMARAFASCRDRVALLARGVDGLREAEREALSVGAEVLAISCDVSDPAAVEMAAAAIHHRFGAIDVWINNAMVSVFSPAARITPDEFRRVLEVNFLGTVNGTLAALRRMRPQRRGTVIQIGSALAYRSLPLQSAYCASKAAIRAFTDSMRSELYHERSLIHLCMAQLPAINTPQFEWVRTRLPGTPRPIPPVYSPEVVAAAIVRASLRPRRELWIGGSSVKAIIGQRLIAPLLDRYMARRGYTDQQDAVPVEPYRPDNLFYPLEGDRGAHGPYLDLERRHSAQIWFDFHKRALAAIATAVVGLTAGALWARARA
ncbi:MAG TPA: SDR family oxidoreductase [Myxococcaceae bacterium]|jgi:NAD(P)-dependent dehydrogenase (short-subunit alcohol dehydrogenase family)